MHMYLCVCVRARVCACVCWLLAGVLTGWPCVCVGAGSRNCALCCMPRGLQQSAGLSPLSLHLCKQLAWCNWRQMWSAMECVHQQCACCDAGWACVCTPVASACARRCARVHHLRAVRSHLAAQPQPARCMPTPLHHALAAHHTGGKQNHLAMLCEFVYGGALHVVFSAHACLPFAAPGAQKAVSGP
jgi:hypothetical protein